MSEIEDKVIEKIAERAEIGLNKYGTTMERGDLSLVEWMTHLQEELMDATVYLERLIQDFSAVENEVEDLFKIVGQFPLL